MTVMTNFATWNLKWNVNERKHEHKDFINHIKCLPMHTEAHTILNSECSASVHTSLSIFGIENQVSGKTHSQFCQHPGLLLFQLHYLFHMGRLIFFELIPTISFLVGLQNCWWGFVVHWPHHYQWSSVSSHEASAPVWTHSLSTWEFSKPSLSPPPFPLFPPPVSIIVSMKFDNKACKSSKQECNTNKNAWCVSQKCSKCYTYM
jgi:hypothetical protein